MLKNSKLRSPEGQTWVGKWDPKTVLEEQLILREDLQATEKGRGQAKRGWGLSVSRECGQGQGGRQLEAAEASWAVSTNLILLYT